MIGVWFLRIAVIYFLAGVVLGTQLRPENRFLIPVHAHLNLLGWASLALSGLIYSVFPTAGANRLALWHFWLHNIGLVVFLIGLTAIVSGHFSVPILVVGLTGAVMVIVAIILLLINVFVNVRPAR